LFTPTRRRKAECKTSRHERLLPARAAAFLFSLSLRRWDAHRIGTARPDARAGNWTEILVQANLHCSQVVVSATERQAGTRYHLIAGREKTEYLIRRHRCLSCESKKRWRNRDRVKGFAGSRKELIGTQPGACSVRPPFMLQQTCVWIDVPVRGDIRWTGRIRAVLGIGSVVPLRPKPVEDKSGMSGAFRSTRMRMAKLRRPREVKEIEVKARCGMARDVGRRRACRL